MMMRDVTTRQTVCVVSQAYNLIQKYIYISYIKNNKNKKI